MKPVIFGLSGPTLTPDERSFFRDCDPAGYIMFRRNCVDRAQLRALTEDLRALSGRDDLAILIDQEGGRVSRMQPPEWPEFPAGAAFDALYNIAPISAMEAARVNAKAIALTLAEVGINVDALPLLDVRTPDTHPAIGDRALGADPMRVASLGRSVIDGLREGGVVGIVKHIPGQGRAVVDSHHDLPVVDADEAALATDLSPFEWLNTAPIAMTGHIMFPAWDTKLCVTMSPTVIAGIIRGRIGFDGLLLSDDLDMNALSGAVSDRAATCIGAGCDIALNCWGRMDEMIAIARALPEITDAATERLARAMATIAPVTDFAEMPDLIAKRDALLALV
ncbi:glycoside hydrolase family 3 N-terminal domain-containing protein [Sphingomonas sp.]|uniref:glycoside hydrolase family 3 N-terminal domain-containing protein n=1 Tax=Sphingomonas sp. TaxID=28214 RepID=UPI0025F4F5AB|nr:glycoside hydrolase family 3 N-terminal domain-containing protein [Sphingomonas sp.]